MNGGQQSQAWGFATSAVSGAIYSAVTPITALVLLAPTSYGHFSIIYLINAFGISLQYSIVSEAWARTFKSTKSASTWQEYSTMLVSVSAALAFAAAVAAILLPDLLSSWWLFAAAVLCTIYRNGSRYYAIAQGQVRRVLVSDTAGILAFFVTVVALWGVPPLTRMAAAWCASAVVASMTLALPRFQRGASPLAWLRGHGAAIRPLLSDSLLMDAGAIGTPFLLAGFMGATKFGIYRAVSNAALPVRLIIEPIRPNLGQLPHRQIFSRSVSLLVAAVMVCLSVACYIALVAIVPLLGNHLGTLSSLVEYALPTSVYIAGTFVGTIYFIVCRSNSSHRAIIIGRITQTVLVIVLPIGGFLVGDLNGAIWGYAVSSVLASLVWLRVAQTSNVHEVTPSRD